MSKLKQALIVYESFVKTCILCENNSRCNSCKEKTNKQISNISKYHFGAPISEVTLAIPTASHSGEKSNKCNQCDFASSYASALWTHLKTHSGEKSSKCNQCDYASSRAGDLRAHLKTHNREKSNKCNHCDYASSQADSLKKHLKIHS